MEALKEALRLLSEDTGIEGVERLAALYAKKHPGPHTRAELRAAAKEALAPKASKQMLRFPKEPQSGGAIHASRENEVWQIDTAYMTQFQGTHHTVKFRGSKDYFMIAVDVFTRFTRVFPVATVTAKEAVAWFNSLSELPRMVDSDAGKEGQGAFAEFLGQYKIAHRVKKNPEH